MTTIYRQILLCLCATALIPLVVVFIVSDYTIGDAVRTSEQDKLRKLNGELSDYVALMMERTANDLKSLQTNPKLGDTNLSLQERGLEIQRLVNIYEIFSDISLYDRDGYLLTSTTDDLPSSREYTRWFKEAKDGDTSVSPPLRKVGHEGLFLSVYLPIFDSSSRVENIVRARLKFTPVVSIVNRMTPGKGGFAVLLDQRGNQISTENQQRNFEPFDSQFGVSYWHSFPSGTYESPEKGALLYSAIEMPPDQTKVGETWTLLAFNPQRNVDTLLTKAQSGLIVVCLFTIGLAFLTGILISKRITDPITQLENSAKLVASGDLEAVANESGAAEIKSLASSFNFMVREVKIHQDDLEKLVANRTKKLTESQVELQHSVDRLQAAFQSSKNGILVTSSRGQTIASNLVFYELLKVAPSKIDNSNDADNAILKALDGKIHTSDLSSDRIEKEIHSEKDGEQFLKVFSAPILGKNRESVGRLWTIEDLTEERKAEENKRQSQKMEAIGQLAGGVAHDFNNLLTGIMGNLALLEMEMEDDATVPPHQCERLSLARQTSQRAAELVKQLLGFSRRSHVELTSCRVNDVVKEVTELLRASIDPNITLIEDCHDDAWSVVADSNLLSQVVMNMGVNAKDAMPGGGSISFSTKNVTLTDRHAQETSDARAGDFLCLSIEDNGDGIPEEVQKKIFEPFFTTKEQGKGTGLGLATCFGIAKQLNGWIDFKSEEGVGTRFDIYLPRSVSQASTSRRDQPVKPLSDKNNETLLIVDDEPVVRKVAETMLKKLGYQIYVAGDGQQALEVYEELGDEI
ncbi:MAG: ATP-binding protein, partial [Verrucomicrobiota bacterium]